MLPEASVCHRTPNRLRVKVTSQKGNAAYFSGLQDGFSKYRKFEKLEVNADTGSMLIVDGGLDLEGIARYGEEQELFRLRIPENKPTSLSRRLITPLQDADKSISGFTGGSMDLPGLFFLCLLATGFYQILRGNFGAPPWYTAFWYSMGVFTKFLFEDNSNDNPV